MCASMQKRAPAFTAAGGHQLRKANAIAVWKVGNNVKRQLIEGAACLPFRPRSADKNHGNPRNLKRH